MYTRECANEGFVGSAVQPTCSAVGNIGSTDM